jgi:hypothetical protein
MIPQSVQKSLRNFEEDKKRILQIASAMSQQGLSVSPQGDEWNMTELLEHLVVVEEKLLDAMKKSLVRKTNTKSSFKKTINKLIVGFVLSNGIKVPTVPDRGVDPTGTRSYSDLISSWELLRTELSKMLSQPECTNPAVWDYFVFNHPRVGDCNLDETLWFLSVHLRYHYVRAKKLYRV